MTERAAKKLPFQHPFFIMIIGLGNDIIEVNRIKKIIDKYGQHFLEKLFTQAEQDYCNKYNKSEQHYAGRYAAKEAVVKALGTGFGKKVGFLDIEIRNNDAGKPEVHLSKKGRLLIGSAALQLSISHCHEYASAVAILSD